MISFSEISYNQTTGVHQVEADYKNDPVLSTMPKENIEEAIIQRGGVIIAHPTNKVRFEVTRADVFDEFKFDVKERLDPQYSQRQFKIPSAYVQQALSNGGTLSVTKTQFATYVRNRLDD
jgi:hypothetical protein